MQRPIKEQSKNNYMLNIIQLTALDDNYIYILHDSKSGDTAVIDPTLAAPVLAILQKNHWALKYILNTHHHWDHINANIELKQTTGCQIATSVFDQSRIAGADFGLHGGQTIYLGTYNIVIIDTPGHTQGHIAFYCSMAKALFCGDTLFAMGCGRLLEGSADQLWQSLQKIQALPIDTLIYCAHEYTQNNGLFALTLEADNLRLQQRMAHINTLRQLNLPTIPCTLADELATNPFLRTDSLPLQQKLNLVGASALTIFTALRQLKDHF